ncbi:MAG: hypothetical protein Homavirus24_4 [Homavirus sp.]|uniref:U-box domain-containing protein n=1 Tax=Homavirus sp. TaxID=2487769 RepID=A0A3G5A7T5_9VIRU|nr:MAG: hypothetical protein Homavirus24_4 [Homavirus sp.]
MDIICPITEQIYHNPVLASDGYFYEKTAIMNWLTINHKSPLTRQQLNMNLYKCIEFNQYIDSYLIDHPNEKVNQFKPSMNHLDNVNIINKFLLLKEYDKLLQYENFDFMAIDLYIIDMLKTKRDDIIKHILDKSINLECVNYDRWKPIHFICCYGTPEVTNKIKFILFLAKNKLVLFVKYMIDKGVDLECVNNHGWKPIHFVCRYSTPETIKYLVDKGIDLECTNRDGWKPIHFVCQCHNGIPEIIKYMIDKGIDLECVNNEKWKPIHLVCRYSTPKMIKYLVDKGVDLECVNNNGWKPIHLVCSNGTPEIIKYLINRGVDLESTTNEGWKPIHLLCCYSTPEMIKYLVNTGVNLKYADNNGWKPIHVVCRYQTSRIITYMISKGVDLNSKIKKYEDKDKQLTIWQLMELNNLLNYQNKNDIKYYISNYKSTNRWINVKKGNRVKKVEADKRRKSYQNSRYR